MKDPLVIGLCLIREYVGHQNDFFDFRSSTAFTNPSASKVSILPLKALKSFLSSCALVK